MTKLEQRCRMLMRAYPAAYRRERADEMVGTLLDTTPEGRAWPRPRDTWGLLLGGLDARSAHNWRLGMATNLRLAALFGVAIYLSFAAYEFLPFGLGPWSDPWQGLFKLGPSPDPSLALVQGLLVAMMVLTAWFAGRAVVLIVALAVGTWFYEAPHLLDRFAPAVYVPDLDVVLLLVALAALAALAGGRERPPRVWLCLPALAIAGPLLVGHIPELMSWFYPYLPGVPEIHTALLTLVIIVFLAVLCVDPRPALALAVYFGLFLANQVIVVFVLGRGQNQSGIPGVPVAVECSSAAALLAVLALWRVRRQEVL